MKNLTTLTYDPNLPASLKQLQSWFGAIIQRGIDLESRIKPITPAGHPIKQEAAQFILPGPKLAPWQRIQIYNQQYWWRLLDLLQKDFPFLLHLYGHIRFNEEIATPYLERFPPNHWSLDELGNHLAFWISQHFSDQTKEIAQAAAKIDYAFVQAFIKAHHPALNLQSLHHKASIDQLLSQRVFLQPHITLLQFPFNLLAFRDAIFEKKGVNHWLGHSLPALVMQPSFLILYRTNDFSIIMEELSEAEFYLLQAIQKGATLESASESILHPNQLSSLQEWLIHWLTHEFLYA